MKSLCTSAGSRGFTLPEAMVAMAVSAFMFAAILTATVGFQRSFSGAMNYSRGTTDQQRALDYIARDLRRAYTIDPANNMLTVTVGNYYSAYDAQGNPTPTSTLADPTISGSQVNYGAANNAITICYYLNGGQLLRKQTVGTGSPSILVIADSVENLQTSYDDQTTIVTFTVKFAPTLNSTSSTTTSSKDARDGTTLVGSTSVRNKRRDQQYSP